MGKSIQISISKINSFFIVTHELIGLGALVEFMFMKWQSKKFSSHNCYYAIFYENAYWTKLYSKKTLDTSLKL